MTLIFCLFALHGALASGLSYPETVTQKFESGSIRSKTTYVAYNDVERCETFYANGQKKRIFRRKSKAKDPYSADIYGFQEWNDRGAVTADGDCAIPATEDFPIDGGCFRYTGVRKDYDAAGKLQSEVRLEKGKYEGESKFFTAQRTTVLTYKGGKLVKKVEFKPGTSSILLSEEYLEDGSIKK